LDKAGVRPGELDAIISNPPYVSTTELDNLQSEVRDFEPRLALDGGPDGLEPYRRIISSAPQWLKPQAYLILEIAPELARPIEDILAAQKDFFAPSFFDDSFDITRGVAAQRR